MKLVEIDTGRAISLPELRQDWQTFRTDDPVNHADDFTTELYEILMATVNGRNDYDVDGMTPTETSKYILALRDKIEGRN
jgi:hypothetical protein